MDFSIFNKKYYIWLKLTKLERKNYKNLLCAYGIYKFIMCLLRFYYKYVNII